MRIGTGYDVHAFGSGRPLYLGGVLVPETPGVVAHSDGDVLIHALIDALLGAAALGDIGSHFSDTDPVFKDIESRELLTRTMDMIRARGYSIDNVDSVVCLEQPRIAPLIGAMKKVLCPIMEINEDQLSIKATTSEGIGMVGRKEGLWAQVVVLLV